MKREVIKVRIYFYWVWN